MSAKGLLYSWRNRALSSIAGGNVESSKYKYNIQLELPANKLRQEIDR